MTQVEGSDIVSTQQILINIINHKDLKMYCGGHPTLKYMYIIIWFQKNFGIIVLICKLNYNVKSIT